RAQEGERHSHLLLVLLHRRRLRPAHLRDSPRRPRVHPGAGRGSLRLPSQPLSHPAQAAPASSGRGVVASGERNIDPMSPANADPIKWAIPQTREILMIPGPTELPFPVIQTLNQPPIIHYDQNFDFDVLEPVNLALKK